MGWIICGQFQRHGRWVGNKTNLLFPKSGKNVIGTQNRILYVLIGRQFFLKFSVNYARTGITKGVGRHFGIQRFSHWLYWDPARLMPRVY